MYLPFTKDSHYALETYRAASKINFLYLKSQYYSGDCTLLIGANHRQTLKRF